MRLFFSSRRGPPEMGGPGGHFGVPGSGDPGSWIPGPRVRGVRSGGSGGSGSQIRAPRSQDPGVLSFPGICRFCQNCQKKSRRCVYCVWGIDFTEIYEFSSKLKKSKYGQIKSMRLVKQNLSLFLSTFLFLFGLFCLTDLV